MFWSHFIIYNIQGLHFCDTIINFFLRTYYSIMMQKFVEVIYAFDELQ